MNFSYSSVEQIFSTLVFSKYPAIFLRFLTKCFGQISNQLNIFNHCFNSDNAEYFFTRTTKINCHIAYQAQLQNLTAIIKLVLNRLANDCKKFYQGQNHFCELLNQSLTCLALLYIESPSQQCLIGRANILEIKFEL